jgi:hypothetical protein
MLPYYQATLQDGVVLGDDVTGHLIPDCDSCVQEDLISTSLKSLVIVLLVVFLDIQK